MGSLSWPCRSTVLKVFDWTPEVIADWLAHGQPYIDDGIDLFPSARGSQVAERTLLRRFRRYCNDLDLSDGLDLHSLRRSYITHLIEDGWDGIECSRCHRRANKLRVYWPGDQLCHSCFYTAMRTHGICPNCGHDGVLPGRRNHTDPPMAIPQQPAGPTYRPPGDHAPTKAARRQLARIPKHRLAGTRIPDTRFLWSPKCSATATKSRPPDPSSLRALGAVAEDSVRRTLRSVRDSVLFRRRRRRRRVLLGGVSGIDGQRDTGDASS